MAVSGRQRDTVPLRSKMSEFPEILRFSRILPCVIQRALYNRHHWPEPPGASSLGPRECVDHHFLIIRKATRSVLLRPQIIRITFWQKPGCSGASTHARETTYLHQADGHDELILDLSFRSIKLSKQHCGLPLPWCCKPGLKHCIVIQSTLRTGSTAK